MVYPHKKAILDGSNSRVRALRPIVVGGFWFGFGGVSIYASYHFLAHCLKSQSIYPKMIRLWCWDRLESKWFWEVIVAKIGVFVGILYNVSLLQDDYETVLYHGSEQWLYCFSVLSLLSLRPSY